MSELPVTDGQMASGEAEPLLPIEKILIGWSLGVGLVSLVGLLILNWLFPLF